MWTEAPLETPTPEPRAVPQSAEVPTSRGRKWDGTGCAPDDVTCGEQSSKSWHATSQKRSALMTTFLSQQVKQMLGSEHLARPLKILDYGCSTGLTTLSVAKVFPQSKLIGFDVDDKSIQEARKMAAKSEGFASRVEFVSHLEQNLIVDGLSCLNVFAAGASIQELAKKLDGLLMHVKPGGFLWVVFKTSSSTEVIQQLLKVLPSSDVSFVLRSPAEQALDQRSLDGSVVAPLYLGLWNRSRTNFYPEKNV